MSDTSGDIGDVLVERLVMKQKYGTFQANEAVRRQRVLENWRNENR